MKNFIVFTTLFLTTGSIFCAEATRRSTVHQRRARTTYALGALSLSLDSGLDRITSEENSIRLVFSEFPEPPTPSAQDVELYGLSLTLVANDHTTSIIFNLPGGPLSPSKNHIDFGDKSGSAVFDNLKSKLPQKPDAPKTLLVAILAKQVRMYMQSLTPDGKADPVDIKTLQTLAKAHEQERIVEILENILKHNKYDQKIYHAYDHELCKLQKPAERLLTDSGLVLGKSIC